MTSSNAANPGAPGEGAKAPTRDAAGRLHAVAPASPRLSILLVEDRADFGKTLTKTLERWGEVTWARTFDEALGAFSQRVFSALIVDVRLEGPSGFAVLERFRRQHAETPAMVLTGFFAEADSVRACELGAQYVAKPITHQALQRFLEDARPTRALDMASYGLSPAERRVYALLAQRLTNREAAAVLQVSAETVKSHVKQIFSKLGLRSRKEIHG